MPITDKIEQVITDLGDTRDDLTALLDDIWLDIDHTNQASIKNGSERMISTLDAAANFRKAGDELTAKLRGFLPPPLVVPAPPTTAPSATAPATPAQQHNYFASMDSDKTRLPSAGRSVHNLLPFPRRSLQVGTTPLRRGWSASAWKKARQSSTAW